MSSKNMIKHKKKGDFPIKKCIVCGKEINFPRCKLKNVITCSKKCSRKYSYPGLKRRKNFFKFKGRNKKA